MTWLIWLTIGLSIAYYFHYKTMDVPRSELRQTPIINTGIQKLDWYIFIGGYVIVFLTIYFSGENPFYFFENNEWAGGLSIPLQYGWWYMFLQGRKEMNKREEDKKRREEWKKNNPKEWKKLNED